MHATDVRRLREVGLRVTQPRLAVLAVLDAAGEAGEHLLVAELVDRTRDRLGGVSTQTVYDCLDALGRVGVVRRVETAGSPARYEARVGDNHHHLVCRSCGRTVDVDCAVGAPPCLQPSEDHGFVVDEAEVVFWGTCPGCLASEPSTAPDSSTASELSTTPATERTKT